MKTILRRNYGSAHVVVIDSRGKVLLLKRSKQSNFMPNKWGLPGGRIEDVDGAVETPMVAAVRETKEEANIKIDGLKYVCNKGGNTFFFVSREYSGFVEIDSESQKYIWASEDDIRKMKPHIVPGLSEIIQISFDI